MKQKDIILVPFPFTNLIESKIRPVIIISNDKINFKSLDCIVIPLTTVMKEAPYSFTLTNNDLNSGELIQDSMLRVDHVFTIEKESIIKKIGTVNDKTFDKIKENFIKILN